MNGFWLNSWSPSHWEMNGKTKNKKPPQMKLLEKMHYSDSHWAYKIENISEVHHKIKCFRPLSSELKWFSNSLLRSQNSLPKVTLSCKAWEYMVTVRIIFLFDHNKITCVQPKPLSHSCLHWKLNFFLKSHPEVDALHGKPWVKLWKSSQSCKH